MDALEAFCCVASFQAQEAQYGTAAAGVDAWFALECDGPWAAKAWLAAPIPEPARAHVDAWVDATPGARVQLIRREQRRTHGDVVLLLANGRQDHPSVAEYRLQSFDQLVDLDLTAAITALRMGELPTDAHAPTQPVALVCTNGKRDRCCAKWGVPVYEAMAADPRVQTWQTTHLGGHRFAATMVWLPSGLCHGRVAPEHIDGLISAIAGGQIGPLDLLRGRASLVEAAQAAEYLLRKEHGLAGLDEVVIEHAEAQDDRWLVSGRVLDRRVRIELREVSLGVVAPPSCGKDPQPISRWEVVSTGPGA